VSTRMRIVERRIGDVTILQAIGRLELEDGDIVLRDTVNRLVEAGRVKLVLDMKEVTRLDSAGIGMLVSKYLTARRGGGVLKILHPTDRTDHLMDITKLTTVFEIFDDEEEAIRSFGGSSVEGV
jgi:anti-sigma B factor antagonist